MPPAHPGRAVRRDRAVSAAALPERRVRRGARLLGDDAPHRPRADAVAAPIPLRAGAGRRVRHQRARPARLARAVRAVSGCSTREGIMDHKLDPALDGVAPANYYRSTYQSEPFTHRRWGRVMPVEPIASRPGQFPGPRRAASRADAIAVAPPDREMSAVYRQAKPPPPAGGGWGGVARSGAKLVRPLPLAPSRKGRGAVPAPA